MIKKGFKGFLIGQKFYKIFNTVAHLLSLARSLIKAYTFWIVRLKENIICVCFLVPKQTKEIKNMIYVIIRSLKWLKYQIDLSVLQTDLSIRESDPAVVFIDVWMAFVHQSTQYLSYWITENKKPWFFLLTLLTLFISAKETTHWFSKS